MLQLPGDDIVSVVLVHLEEMVPYLAVFPRICRLTLKAVLRVWSSAGGSDTGVHAFLVLRRLATDVPYPFVDLCLKVRRTERTFSWRLFANWRRCVGCLSLLCA